MTLVLVDPYAARGGGQVVLEEILRLVAKGKHDCMLVMPSAGRSKLSVPLGVRQLERIDELSRILAIERPTVLVSNANASHLSTLVAAKKLRKSGHRVTTIAILHNYPRTRAREVALQRILKRFDDVIAVEPGLRTLAPALHIPSWLSLSDSEADRLDGFQQADRDQSIKSFARPDPPKGLHLLAPIYAALSERGFSCEVAIGESVSSNRRYSDRVVGSLAPWVVQGRRGPEWLEAGDIFVSTSTFGEAACLSAQEAIFRGAIVVAPRLGLMPYLSPTQLGIRTYQTGNTKHALEEIESILAMSSEDRILEGRAGADQIRQRVGAWHQEVVDLITSRAS